MKIKKDPGDIRKEFAAGQQYKEAIGLYENYARNEDFYVGNQWRGVDSRRCGRVFGRVLYG